MFYVHGSGGMENDDNDVAGNDDNDRQNVFWLKPCLKLLPKKKKEKLKVLNYSKIKTILICA